MVEKGRRARTRSLASPPRCPLGRLVQPEEVAAAVLYLCSPEAAAVTGTTLVIGAEGS